MDRIIALSVAGLLVSIYTLYVKFKLSPTYKPLCDINAHISCSKALTSKEANLLFLPNALYGILLYLLIMLAQLYAWFNILQISIFIALVMSLYLAYVSYFKQKNFCLVCTISYIINIFLFIIVFQ